MTASVILDLAGTAALGALGAGGRLVIVIAPSPDLAPATTRIDGWPLAVQWASPFSELFAFRTEIIRAERGNEQRIAQRTRPRISYEFTSIADGDRLQRMLEVVAERQARLLWFLIPGSGATLTSSAAADDLQISVDVVPAWAQFGERIFLQSGRTVEVATVETTIPGGINLVSGLGQPSLRKP